MRAYSFSAIPRGSEFQDGPDPDASEASPLSVSRGMSTDECLRTTVAPHTFWPMNRWEIWPHGAWKSAKTEEAARIWVPKSLFLLLRERKPRLRTSRRTRRQYGD
jgi:hypothetical protein